MLNLPRWQTIVIIAITVLSGLFALARFAGNVAADLDWAGGPVGGDDIAAVRNAVAGHLERPRRRAVAEQPLALAEYQRGHHQRQLVEQPGREQLRIERAAALNQKVAALALLELGHGVRGLS